VIPYYQRFLADFPDVFALAAAPAAAVMARWAGLGYYARARNLHACAQAVVAQHGGRFPADPALLAALPGIGRSTAAAISAFAFGTRAAILDGNVKRVLTRCFGIAGFPGASAVERELWALAGRLLPARQIEAYTQGIMDLGATLCTRSRPACAACPLASLCVARREGRQDELPTPKPAKSVPRREAVFLVIDDGMAVWLERRPAAGIWGGLLALPEVPIAHESVADPAAAAASVLARLGLVLQAAEPLPPLEHAFSHYRLTLRPLLCRAAPGGAAGVGEPGGGQWVPWAAVADAGLPAPLRRLLEPLAAQRR
jgi:A/G-specific adenine glycosylase